MRNRFRAFGLALLFFAITGCGQWSRLEHSFSDDRSFEIDEQNGFLYAWRAPRGKSADHPAKNFFVLFHPAGSTGDEFLEKWNSVVGSDENLILAPTATGEAPYGSNTFEKELLSVIQNFQSGYSVHPDKTFLIGESNGAIYGFRFLADHPELFRAAVLISGVLNQDVINRIKNSPPLRKTPILMIHGTDDQTFNVQIAEKESEFLKKMGLAVEFQKVEGMGHGADAFTEDDAARWLRKFE